jgi:capsular exopolysaccharide synthesis family protein
MSQGDRPAQQAGEQLPEVWQDRGPGKLSLAGPAEDPPAGRGRDKALVPPTLSRTPTLPGLLAALQRRWLLALVLAFPCAAAAVLVTQAVMPVAKYTVAAMVHIASVPEAVLGQANQDNETKFTYFQKTQMTLVKSQIVLDAVLKDPRVAALPIVGQEASPKEWLAREIEVDFSKGPEILRIAMKGDKTDELKILINAVMKAYLDEFINTEERRRRAHLEQLTELRTGHEKILAQKRAALRAFAPRMGNGDARALGGIHGIKMQQLGLVSQDLHRLQADRARLESALKAQQSRLKAAADAPVSPVDVEREIQDDPLVKAHQSRLAVLEVGISDIKTKATTPAVAESLLRQRGMLDDLDATRAALDRHLAELRPKVTGRLRQQTLAKLEAEATQTADQLLLVTEQEKTAAKIVADLNEETKSVGQETFQMALAAREVEEEEKMVSAIVGEIRALQVELLAPPRAKPLDEAIVSSTNDGKKKLMAAAGAGVGAFALVLLGVGWWEFCKRKITSADEVTHGFGVNLVGTVPWLPARVRNRPVLARYFHGSSRYSDSIDSYRTLLFRNCGEGAPQVVMITSAMPSEGKTLLASQLALSVARSGSKTLLLDLDLRHPSTHRVFGVSQGPGLAEVVRGEADVAAVIRPTFAPGLSIITAGEPDLQAVHALTGDEVRKLFDHLKQEFDFIVVDGCPVLPVADSLQVAPHVDGVLFSFLHRVSRMPKAAAALQRLKRIGVPVLGAVLNGSDEDVYSSVYYSPAAAEE